MARIRLIVLLFLLLPSFAVQAGEGFCRGNQERARIVFEGVGFRLDSLFEAGFQKARQLAHEGFRLAARLAVWQIHLRAWQRLAEGLEDAGRDRQSLIETMRPLWHQALLILGFVDREPADRTASPDKAVTDALAAYSVCRAITLGHAEPCMRLSPKSPDRVEECRELFVNFGILFSHRCDPQSVTLAAWLVGMQFQDALDWCDILKRGALEKCKLGADQSPYELAGCRAMASMDGSYCHGLGMNPDQEKDCLGKLETYRYVRGLLPEEQWRPWMHDPVFECAVQATRSSLQNRSPDCLRCARRAYLRGAADILWLPE